MLHEGCWTVTEFQKRWLTVVTLTNFGIHLISREHENEKDRKRIYDGKRAMALVPAGSSALCILPNLKKHSIN